MASRARLILVERMITFARCVIHAERSIFVGCTGSGIVAPELRTWRGVAYVRMCVQCRQECHAWCTERSLLADCIVTLCAVM